MKPLVTKWWDKIDYSKDSIFSQKIQEISRSIIYSRRPKLKPKPITQTLRLCLDVKNEMFLGVFKV